jgi:hypothetical protein
MKPGDRRKNEGHSSWEQRDFRGVRDFSGLS